MPSKIKREISCFTADFLDGKVSIGGETFPSGCFFVNAMNEYWKPYSGDDDEDFEIAQKLKVVKFNRDKVQDEITLNFLYPDHAEKLYDDVQYYLENIARAKPFCFLDLDAEYERCKRIFGAENVAAIATYLRERSFFNYEHDSDWANHVLPNQSDIDRFRVEENRLREFSGAIEFYEEMGHGMHDAREIGRLFVEALEAPTKRTESNLMAMATECILKHRPDFTKAMQTKVEYVPVPKSKKQNAFEIGRRMIFERFGDFLLVDFFEGLHAGHYPLLCDVCKQYFLQTTAHRPKYCQGFAPNDPKGRTCVAFAARSNRLEKERTDDYWVHEIYNTRRGTINKHLQRGKITEHQADKAKRYIEDLLYKATSATEKNKGFLEHYEEYMAQDAVYVAVGIKLS